MFKKYFIGIFVFLVFVILLTQEHLDNEVLNSVKSGDKVLTCHMLDGIRSIDKDLVVDYKDGVFYFVNGSSKSCSLK